MKNFLKKSILPFLIAILFLATIVTFISSAFVYHKIILKSLGIYIQDNCHLESLGKLKCDFIEVSNRKNFFFNIRDFYLDISLRKEKPVYIYAENIDGLVIPEKEKKKRKKSNINLKPLFYVLKLSNIQIKNFNLEIKQKKPFLIKHLSLDTTNHSIKTFRPFFINIGKNQIKIEKIYGKYTDTLLTLENAKVLYKNGILTTKGFIDIKENIELNGKLFFPELKNTFTIKDLKGNFSFKGNLNEKIKGNITYKISKIQNKNVSVENSYGFLRLTYKDYLHGKNELFIGSVLAKKIKIRSVNLKTHFFIKNRISADNTLIVKELNINKYSLKYLSSVFNIEKKETTQIAGKVFYKDIYTDFELVFSKNPYLSIDIPEYSLNHVLKTFAFDKKIKDIDFLFSGSYFLNLKKLTGKANISLKKILFYGLSFPKGNIVLNQNIKENLLSFKGTLKNNNSLIDINGTLKKLNLKSTFSFKDIEISNLIYAKKYDFSGIFSGKGKIYGKLPDIVVKIDGSTNYIRYKNLVLNNLQYSFFYRKKHIDINVKDFLSSINTDINISFSPLNIRIKTALKNADLKPAYPLLISLSPNVFNQIRPEVVTGKVNVDIKNKKYKISFDIKKGDIFIIPANDYITVITVGKISPNLREIKASFIKNNFHFQDKFTLNEIKGLFYLKNNEGNISLEVKGIDKLDYLDAFGAVSFNLKRKSVDGDIFSTFRYKDYKTVLNTNITGSFQKIKGIMFTEVYFKKEKFTENFLNYTLDTTKKFPIFSFKTDTLNFFIKNIEFLAKKSKGEILLKKNPQGKVEINYILVKQNNIEIFKTKPIKVILKNSKIIMENLEFSGDIEGRVKTFSYNIPDTYLILESQGKIKHQLLSQFILFGSIDGYLNYKIKSKGKLTNLIKSTYIKAYSNNLKLRSSYLRGFTKFSKFTALLKNGVLDVEIFGKSSSSISGESNISIKGSLNIDSLKNSFFLKGKLIPVRYPGIFEGNINTDIKTYSTKKKEQIIKGKIDLTGRVRIEKDLANQFSKKSLETPNQKENKNLEKIKLDLNIKTFTPVYLYGSLGNAYAELDLTVKGTAKKPIVNGSINIIYGKIKFMKIKYNIDYAKIKIINNEAYISARVSTVITNTFIYININGNLKNPNLSFSSVPPKSKSEILSILLLKDTPSTLESLPLFSTLGKVIYAFLPFGSEEDEGLFNTGFTISITPSYDPLYGITASIYARKNLSRRFYIAISKPIREVEGLNIFGWYEIGAHLTEKTSLFFRWYENNTEEAQIMFSLPFDLDFDFWRRINEKR